MTAIIDTPIECLFCLCDIDRPGFCSDKCRNAYAELFGALDEGDDDPAIPVT